MRRLWMAIPILALLMIANNLSGSDLIVGDQESTKGDFYISPEGNDAWTGTLSEPNRTGTDGPFASLERARKAASALRQAQSQHEREHAITVMFREGTYILSSTVEFSRADSGSPGAPIIYENYPREVAVISGGMRVKNWKNLTGNHWQVTLPTETLYFENLFYNGQRRLRPRLGGYLGTYYRVRETVFLRAAGTASSPPDPSCGKLTPDRGWECFDRFVYEPADPISPAWQNLAAPAGNPCGQSPGNTNLIGDVELYDFEHFNVPKLRIRCIEAANHIIYLTGATVQTPPYRGFIPRHRYLIENVKDALAEPGQWFLDRSSKPWTLTYLARHGENPNLDMVTVPQVSQLLTASDLRWLVFRGLTFEHDNFTVPPEGYPSPRDDTSMTAAISCMNCEHVVFDGDVITQTSGGGVEFYTSDFGATTANNIFQNGALYDVGGYGIRVGMLPHPRDTDANVVQFTTIENNVIAGYGRVFPAAIGIVQGGGHDNLYTHNEIYDGYHSAIQICAFGCPPGRQDSHGAFKNVISFNHVYNIMQGITSDGGAVYLNTGYPKFTAAGNKVFANKIHDVNDASAMDPDGYGGMGIYLDGQTGLVDVENNLVYRVSADPMFVTSTPPAPNQADVIRNNIFAYGRQGMIGDSNPYPTGRCPETAITALSASNNIFYFDRDITMNFMVQKGCTYSCGFPYAQYQDWSSNLYWRRDGSFERDTRAFHRQDNPASPSLCSHNPSSWTFYPFRDWQRIVGEDSESVVKDPGFKNPAYPADDFSLPLGSPGVGFVVFDAHQAGRVNLTIKPPNVQSTFPTQSFDPGNDY